jgi:hypothetical protein
MDPASSRWPRTRWPITAAQHQSHARHTRGPLGVALSRPALTQRVTSPVFLPEGLLWGCEAGAPSRSPNGGSSVTALSRCGDRGLAQLREEQTSYSGRGFECGAAEEGCRYAEVPSRHPGNGHGQRCDAQAE